MFDDVFGKCYAKPIYVEKTDRTAASLENNCEVRELLGQTYYSLIKDRQRRYRFNAEIYNDSHSLLGLPFESERLVSFHLMNLAKREIQTTYKPRASYLAARKENEELRMAASLMVRELPYDEKDLGLIGSLGVDPSIAVRDVDLVFFGNLENLELAHEWIRTNRKVGEPPLKHFLPPPLPPICAFFEAEPTIYPDFSSFRVLESIPQVFEITIEQCAYPSFLNIQMYHASDHRGHIVSLVVRDPLGRDMITPGMRLQLQGNRSELEGNPAILVTDVERQLPSIAFHGGGTECSFTSGESRPL